MQLEPDPFLPVPTSIRMSFPSNCCFQGSSAGEGLGLEDLWLGFSKEPKGWNFAVVPLRGQSPACDNPLCPPSPAVPGSSVTSALVLTLAQLLKSIWLHVTGQS